MVKSLRHVRNWRVWQVLVARQPNVVMSVGFGIPAFAVDTHVERISKHHDIVKKSATPLEVEKRVMDILPPEQWLAAHQAMIYFGRAICHPKNPECDQYPQLYDFSNL